MKNFTTISPAVNQELAARLLATNFAGTVLAGTPETPEDYAAGVMVSGETFTYDSNGLPGHDDSATDGASKVLAFDIDDCTVFLEVNEWADGLHICPAGTSIKTLLKEFDTGDLTMAEHLASWGYDGTPDAAGDDAADVRIWCEPCFYEGTLGAPIGHYIHDEQRDPIIFDDVATAQAWIDSEESGTYMLRNGEASPPTYTICA